MYKNLNILLLVALLSACTVETTSEDNIETEIVDVSTTLLTDKAKSVDADTNSNNNDKENINYSDEANETNNSDSSESNINDKNPEEENQEISYDASVLLPNSTPDKLEVLNFKLNEKININFTSEVETEIHVHGYDIHFMVYPNKENVLELELTIAGEFEIEDHDSGNEFARLIVSP